MDENSLRAGWKTGAHCQIYSNSKKKWFHGEVAQIFTDEEGEWLEVRYDKSMSKQVQRYSSDIRPHPDDLKKKKKPKQKTNDAASPFSDQEMKIRQLWGKGDEVEIFSNTHQEWYLGEVVDIIKDDEGEWLTCVWARANNEAMSKQVQRFSTDVRPVQDDSSTGSEDSDDDPDYDGSGSKSNKSEADKKKLLADQIQSRKHNFRRRAPPFSRTLRPSTWTYPASKIARQQRKLNDLEETVEKNQHVIDSLPTAKNKKKGKKRMEIEVFKPSQVRDFIRSFGSAYEKYVNKFRNVKGSMLLKCNENTLQKMGIHSKLHRNKILLEIARNAPDSTLASLFSHELEVLNWSPMQVEEWCHRQQLLSIYAKKFFHHGIDGMLLFELDAKDLSTIGVKKIHQDRILEIIAMFATKHFPGSNEEEKEDDDVDTLDSVMKDGKDQNPGKKNRGSVAHIDVAGLSNGALNNDMNVNGSQNQNNDAIIYTMGELLLELGQMFKVGKVQDLTTRLQQQLHELQRNSNHPQMLKRQSVNNAIDRSHSNGESGHSNSNANGKRNTPNDTVLMKKTQDTVDTSPTGVDAAWIKTQSGEKGHKRRPSVTFLNSQNQLDNNDDEEEEEEDISDIE